MSNASSLPWALQSDLLVFFIATLQISSAAAKNRVVGKEKSNEALDDFLGIDVKLNPGVGRDCNVTTRNRILASITSACVVDALIGAELVNRSWREFEKTTPSHIWLDSEIPYYMSIILLGEYMI